MKGWKWDNCNSIINKYVKKKEKKKNRGKQGPKLEMGMQPVSFGTKGHTTLSQLLPGLRLGSCELAKGQDPAARGVSGSKQQGQISLPHLTSEDCTVSLRPSNGQRKEKLSSHQEG